jgi:hypothetical protein
MPTLIRLAVASAALGLACGGGARPAERAAARAVAPAVSPSDTTGLLRVRFARGTTSGILNDSLQAGEIRGYLIGAEQGQVMMVHAITWPVRQGEAPPATATVRVFAVADGGELSTASGPGPLWSGRLPGTGDFVVRVNATQPTAYTLAVQIPRRLSVG